MSQTSKLVTQPDLSTFGQLLVRQALQLMNCHALGQITEFDPTTQKASVTLNYKRVVNGIPKDYPVLAECPCVILQGGGGRLTFPIEAGDSALIFFNDVNMDSWVTTGSTGAPPADPRSHSYADAIALVGLNAFPQALTDYFTDGVELALGDGKLQFTDSLTTLMFGDTMLQLAAKVLLTNSVGKSLGDIMTEILTALNTLLTAYGGYSGATPVTGAQIGVPAAAALASLTAALVDSEALLS